MVGTNKQRWAHVYCVISQPDVIAEDKLQLLKWQETLQKVPAAASSPLQFNPEPLTCFPLRYVHALPHSPHSLHMHSKPHLAAGALALIVLISHVSRMSIFNQGFIFLKKWNLAGIICIVPPGSKTLSLMFGKFQDPGVKVDWKNNRNTNECIPLQMTQNRLNLLCWTAAPWNTRSDGQMLGTCGSTQTGPLVHYKGKKRRNISFIFFRLLSNFYWNLSTTFLRHSTDKQA